MTISLRPRYNIERKCTETYILGEATNILKNDWNSVLHGHYDKSQIAVKEAITFLIGWSLSQVWVHKKWNPVRTRVQTRTWVLQPCQKLSLELNPLQNYRSKRVPLDKRISRKSPSKWKHLKTRWEGLFKGNCLDFKPSRSPLLTIWYCRNCVNINLLFLFFVILLKSIVSDFSRHNYCIRKIK